MATRLDRHKDKKNTFFDFINRLSTRLKIIIAIHILFAIFILSIDNLDYAAKVSIVAFLSAMTLWVATKAHAGYVAVSLIVLIVFMNAGEPELLYHSFGEEVIGLMIGAFIMGEAINNAGLADTFSQS